MPLLLPLLLLLICRWSRNETDLAAASRGAVARRLADTLLTASRSCEGGGEGVVCQDEGEVVEATGEPRVSRAGGGGGDDAYVVGRSMVEKHFWRWRSRLAVNDKVFVFVIVMATESLWLRSLVVDGWRS